LVPCSDDHWLTTFCRYTEDSFEEATLGDVVGDGSSDFENKTKRKPLDIPFSKVSFSKRILLTEGSLYVSTLR